MRHVRRFTRSHDGGGKPGNDRHRATAGAEPRQGELQLTLCGRSDDRRPREDQGQPQTNIRICGQTRASEVDHRRLKASLPPLHDHPHRGPPGENRRGERNVALSRLDMGHQSVIRHSPRSGGLRLRLILLRHSLRGLYALPLAPQHGHRASLCTIALIKRMRMVAIEFGT